MTLGRLRVGRLAGALAMLAAVVAAAPPTAGATPSGAAAPARAAVAASVTVLAPDADAYVRNTWPSSNYGLKGSLQVDASPEVLESYLRFTVPATVGAVEGATLRLFGIDDAANGGTLYRVADTAWSETTITWNTKPAPGPAVAAVGAVPLSGWVELDVSAAVTASGSYAFAITTPSTNGAAYASRENATAENRPQLVVRAAPPPADTTAPTVPTGLAAQATSPSTVQLSWSPSADDSGVAGYTVYRDGAAVATTTATSFTDGGLSPSTTYAYAVDAFDAAGNRAAQGAAVSVTTPAPDPVALAVSPDADAYVRSNPKNGNFGTQPTLEVDASPTVHESYLRFTVPSSVASVRRATLRLFAVDDSSSGGTLYRVADTTWSETGLTWKSKPALGPAVRPVGAVPLSAWVELDVSAVVTGPGAYSFAITTASANGSGYVSREGTAAARPLLVVEATPSDTVTTPSPDPVIAAAGDIACDPASASFNGGAGTATECRMMATSDLLVGRGLATVVALGDNQYEAGTLAQYVASYDQTWGRVRPITRPVPGNKEYLTAGAADYFAYFGAAAGDAGQGWYSFDVGTWHMIALNSNCAAVGGCGTGSPQEQWLRADLAAHPAACTLAYWHHPRFSSRFGADGSYLVFWQALYDAGVDVVLAGHSHNYERFAPQDPNGTADPARGIRQFVVGTGGKNHQGASTILANSEVLDVTTFGVLELTLRPAGYDWRFVAEPGATFTDAGSETCH